MPSNCARALPQWAPNRVRPRQGLGGSSSINAMIYMRGQQSDYDQWAQLGNRGWSWDDVLPLFKSMERYQHGADEFHGGDGELRVEERRVSWDILDAWQKPPLVRYTHDR